MMPLGEEVGVVVVEAAMELAVKAAKSPLQKIIHRWVGKKMLVVGPRNTGKTSFGNFIRYGILADEEIRLVSEDEEVFSTFSVETDNGQKLSARFRYVNAIPGELHIVKQTQVLRLKKPHLCVVMFDLEDFMPPNNNDESPMIVWFKKFSRLIVQQSVRLSDKQKEKIRLLIVLNKSDKVTATVLQQARKRIAFYLEEILTQEFSNHMRTVTVLPCCLVDSPSHAKHRNALMRRLLAELQ